jgi:hypothetical protein
MTPARNRLLYLGLALGTIPLGLLIRSTLIPLPYVVAAYLGDVLWPLVPFFLLCAAFPQQKTRTLALATLLFAFTIEFTQLYRAPWINAVREIRVLGLVLGYGFEAMDFVCYAVGIGLGVGVDVRLDEKTSASQL